MPNGNGYNTELCQQKHQEVDRRLDDMEESIKKFNGRLLTIIVLMAGNLIGMVGTLLRVITISVTGNG